jgi:hypothetical protein
MKKSEKTHQGLYNVGFIGNENGLTLFENSSKISARAHITENIIMIREDFARIVLAGRSGRFAVNDRFCLQEFSKCDAYEAPK